MSAREPIDSAEDAKTYAGMGDTNRALVALADAIEGIAFYQGQIRSDLEKIKRAMGIS